jgi:hypothetical protein
MKNRTLISIALFAVFTNFNSKAQVGISTTNTPPAASAMLDVSSNSKGFLPPRMSTMQRNAIASPANGLIIFDTDLKDLYVYDLSVLNWKKAGGTTTIPNPLELSSPVTTISGISTNPYSNDNGVRGETHNNSHGGTGVYGFSNNANPDGDNWGVFGWNQSMNGFGVGTYGKHSGSGIGVKGEVVGKGTAIYGQVSGLEPGVAVKAEGNIGIGILASNNSAINPTSNFTNTGGGDGINVEVNKSNTIDGVGIVVEGHLGKAISASSSSNNSNKPTGYFANNSGLNGVALKGEAFGGSIASVGVLGTAMIGFGVIGNTSSGFGVSGQSAGSGFGGYFTSSEGIAINGQSFSLSQPAAHFYNENGVALEINGEIKIPIASSASNKPIFVHTATAANTSGSQTVVNYPNALPTDFLLITQIFGGVVMDPHPTAISHNGTNWIIFNINSTPMPINATFNVMVIKQ